MACILMAYITKRWRIRIMALSRSFSSFDTPEEEYDGLHCHTTHCTHHLLYTHTSRWFLSEQLFVPRTIHNRLQSTQHIQRRFPSPPFSPFLLPLSLPPSVSLSLLSFPLPPSPSPSPLRTSSISFSIHASDRGCGTNVRYCVELNVSLNRGYRAPNSTVSVVVDPRTFLVRLAAGDPAPPLPSAPSLVSPTSPPPPNPRRWSCIFTYSICSRYGSCRLFAAKSSVFIFA